MQIIFAHAIIMSTACATCTCSSVFLSSLETRFYTNQHEFVFSLGYKFSKSKQKLIHITAYRYEV